MNNDFFRVLFCGFTLLAAAPVLADTTDFGGRPERFKGAGDKVPPQCQIDVPKAATEAFFVTWNCEDNFSSQDVLRSEIWVQANGAPSFRLLNSYLGFPASLLVDAGVLGVSDFTSGLPVNIRLVTKDRAGNAAISPIFTVRSQDNSSLSVCSLNISTEATESNGSTTGTPSLSVEVDNAKVTTSQSSDTSLSISSAGNVIGAPCEINSVCTNDDILSFSSALNIAASSAVSGTISIVPGSVVVNVTGSGSLSDNSLDSLEVSGQTRIDGLAAEVSLSCSK